MGKYPDLVLDRQEVISFADCAYELTTSDAWFAGAYMVYADGEPSSYFTDPIEALEYLQEKANQD